MVCILPFAKCADLSFSSLGCSSSELLSSSLLCSFDGCTSPICINNNNNNNNNWNPKTMYDTRTYRDALFRQHRQSTLEWSMPPAASSDQVYQLKTRYLVIFVFVILAEKDGVGFPERGHLPRVQIGDGFFHCRSQTFFVQPATIDRRGKRGKRAV